MTQSPTDTFPTFESLGHQTAPRYTQLPTEERSSLLETFDAPPGLQDVTLEFNPITSLCPVTGGDDYYTATVSYKPNRKCLETKSVTNYRRAWRMEAVFCEQLAVDICLDIMTACAPFWCRVVMHQKERGNIALSATAEMEREEAEHTAPIEATSSL